jgi:hypothetical protein
MTQQYHPFIKFSCFINPGNNTNNTKINYSLYSPIAQYYFSRPDGEGVPQVALVAPPYPDGASGLNSELKKI